MSCIYVKVLILPTQAAKLSIFQHAKTCAMTHSAIASNDIAVGASTQAAWQSFTPPHRGSTLRLCLLMCSYVEGPRQPVYRVVFYQKDLWEGYNGTDDDNLEIEVCTVA